MTTDQQVRHVSLVVRRLASWQHRWLRSVNRRRLHCHILCCGNVLRRGHAVIPESDDVGACARGQTHGGSDC